jgi:small subunit ribosomal protein S27Ae|eukprot:scaffold1269_cov242-Chaetoceros_neogracile.AAC.7
MQIFVNTHSGSVAYDVEATTSIDTLKAMIENKEFIPSHLIRLVNGANSVDAGTLAGNGVEDEATIALMLDVEAGMRKKWKKKRMRRLRRKRRKMRQRAR